MDIKQITISALTSIILLSGCQISHTVTYSESNDSLLKNPERGLYANEFLPSSDYSGHSSKPRVPDWIKKGPYSTFVEKLVLVDFKHSKISNDYLNRVKEQFRLIREAGMKVVLIITYNEHMNEEDAPIDIVLEHIKQFGPILEENKDVIMAMKAGFIGAWGEWHDSTNDLTTPENMKKIKDALMKNVPKEIKLMFRRPSFIMSWYQDALTEDEANSGSDKSRAGFDDDCFNWNITDAGTFSKDKEERKIQYDYLGQSTKYTSVVGEMCSWDVTTHPENTVSCKNGIDMAEKFHYSILGNQVRGSWNKDIKKLPVEVYQEEGCWDEFKKRLGYRFVLKNAKLPQEIFAGDKMDIALDFVNKGFSATVNKRPVYIVLANDKKEYKFKVDADPRKWYGSKEIKLHIGKQLPYSIEPGDYTLYLWLPDKSPKLQKDKRYSIRFANTDIWDDNKGYNRLGIVKVK